MGPDLDRRTYGLLRLVDRHEPIGSIQLVELMNRYGYEIKDRTIRLLLSDLDERGLTKKVPGKGRRLTDRGREELTQGDIDGRLEQVRSRIATLAGQATYDPNDDAGTVVASATYIDEPDLEAARSLVADLDALPFGPFVIDLAESSADEPGSYRLLAPSSITLDGVLLSYGVNARLASASILEYEATAAGNPDHHDPDPQSPDQAGGRIHRYLDVISGEGSTIDVLSLLIEAGRTDVLGTLEDGEIGLVVGDDREFPVEQFAEARELAELTRAALGGTYALRRPRDRRPLPNGEHGWTFSSLTFIGPGEVFLAALAEADLAASWETLYDIVPRGDLSPVDQLLISEPGDGVY